MTKLLRECCKVPGEQEATGEAWAIGLLSGTCFRKQVSLWAP
jgi:hypothetical protein